MNDASIVRMLHLWGRKAGVATSTIHDAVFTNVAELDKTTDALRQIYARAATFPQILETLKAMREDGLSEASYRKFLAEARAIGLIGNPLTSEELLAPIPRNLGYYGWGP